MKSAGCTHVVMEVSSHSLYSSRVAGIDFAVGAFTNLTQDHLDFHHTWMSMPQQRRCCFPSVVGCINIDDKWADNMMKNAPCRLLTYSADGKRHLVAENIKLSAKGCEFKFGVLRRKAPM